MSNTEEKEKEDVWRTALDLGRLGPLVLMQTSGRLPIIP